eukprot:7309055-Prymnesium_polylepis.1
MKIKDCLEVIGFSAESVTDTTDWSVIKAAYRQKILLVHPDKPTGSDAEFRAVRAAYEALRALYEKSPTVFLSNLDADAACKADGVDDLIPSFTEWLVEEEETPTNRVELAKSGMSACTGCGNKIEKGEIRTGSLDPISGAYGRWACLSCWRVPFAIHSLAVGGPFDTVEAISKRFDAAVSEAVLSGYDRLNEEEKLTVCKQIANRDKWAKFVTKSAKNKDRAKAADKTAND